MAAIAALSGGRLTLEGTRRRDLRLIARVYERLGLHISLDEDAVVVPVHERFACPSRDEDVDVSVESSPWPGFPSDLIAMATVVATQARGTALIHEKLFNNRMLFVDRLTAMGAQIVLCDPHRAIVVGPTRLNGDYVDNPDVRTGLAMLGAALCAYGETVIDGAETFDRSFEDVLDKLVAAWRTHPARGAVSMAIELRPSTASNMPCEVTARARPVLLLHGWGGRIESMQRRRRGADATRFSGARIWICPALGAARCRPRRRSRGASSIMRRFVRTTWNRPIGSRST